MAPSLLMAHTKNSAIMLSYVLLGLLSGLIVALLLLAVMLPTRICYVETITLRAPKERIYDAIRYQSQLMEWSAWPTETQTQCQVKGPDGQVGAQTVYTNKGKPFGYQEITELEPTERISFYLTSKTPFEQKTYLHFHLIACNASTTEVWLYFDNTLKRPSHLLPHLFGIIRWTRQMHLKDLAGLKGFVEEDAMTISTT